MSAYDFYKRAPILALALFFVLTGFSSQISDIVSRVNVGVPHPGEPLRIEAELINAAVIERVEIAYRSFGQSTYRLSEMSLVGNTATVVIPAVDLAPPFLEYYIILHKRDGAPTATFPVLTPSEHPLKVDLQAPGEGGESTIIILSPEQNDNIEPEDLYVSYSLLRADSTVDPANIKTYIDGNDYSESAVRSGNLVVVRPAMTLPPGKHTVRVDVGDGKGNVVETISWEFSSTEPGTTAPLMGPSTWTYHYNAQAETRNENIQDVVTPFNRLRVAGNADYGQYRILGNVYLTNEEKDTRQPQNRYFIGAEASWLKLGYGDHYPVFPEFIMNGIRVRGAAGNLTLGTFNLDVSQGEIVRHVESDTIKTFPADSLAAEQQRDPTGAYGVYDATSVPVRWAKFSYGTYDRSVFAIRPSFGSRDGGHIGLSYLKSKDDMGSIKYGSKPKENAVAGVDALMPFDNRRIEITAEAAFSATNEDITNGTFTDEQIDSVFSDLRPDQVDNIKKIRNAFEKIITVNENLVPLNMTNTPTLAYEGAIALNYFDNYFKFTYLRHGNSFESFGQAFTRTDVVGYNVNDHLRLMNGQWLVTGGFERLEDNTANTKPATTTFTTGTVSVGWFPQTNAPNVTVAYYLASSLNDIASSDSLYPLYGVDDQSNRILLQVGKDFMFGARHNASAGISFSNRDDHTPNNLDTKNTTFTLSNISTFAIPLQTILSLNYVSNSFKIPTGFLTTKDTTIGYTTLFIQATYRMFHEKLRLMGALSPTFGDIERTMIDARAQYFILTNLSLIGQTSFFLNKSTTNDYIWSFILRLDM